MKGTVSRKGWRDEGITTVRVATGFQILVPWRCVPGRSVPVTIRPLDFCNEAPPGQNVPWTKGPLGNISPQFL
jgi:hypothetical protein